MSSDIARGIIERLKVDEKRLDWIEKHGVGITKLSDLVANDGVSWVIIPPNRRYHALSSGKTLREALDKAIKVVADQQI